ncbi:MAG: sensor histidine kinase, partial [Coriobacteriia bacterium]|nr:sensor histidine kinase [Coriobacteriia bacterium]
RIYVNGRLLGGAGEPGETLEATTADNRYMSFTAWAEDGELVIIEQAANFVHKDNFEPMLRFYVGNEEALSNWTTRFNAFPVIEIGIYLLMFIVHLLLFLTLPRYRANLWLALLCLAWALRTGVIGTKLWLSLLPWLSWEAAFRIEYLGFPVSLLLLSLAYHELFSNALQKGFRVLVYCATSIAAILILFTNTMPLSNAGVPMIALGACASAYVLARILWTTRRPNTEQKLVLAGIGVLMLALIADTLYFNSATSSSIPGSMMETALILFSLMQMTALLHATMRETALAKQAEQRLTMENVALDRVNRLKSDLIATVSHEIRTPLTVISTHAQLADREMKKGNNNDHSLERLGVITREANRLADLSGNLLYTFKESESLQGRAPLSIDKLITQTAMAFKPIMEKKGNRQTVLLEPQLPLVFGNADELTQVLFNLLANADTHTNNGEIGITAKLMEGEELIRITVSDTGEGIAPEIIPHILEKRVHDEKGTGYGLMICKEIIEAHGGSITIESAQGKGTDVTLTLPAMGEESTDE